MADPFIDRSVCPDFGVRRLLDWYGGAPPEIQSAILGHLTPEMIEDIDPNLFRDSVLHRTPRCAKIRPTT